VKRILVIAEAGVNHNGDLEIARALVREASKAGADIVKFQTFKTESLVNRHARKADYQVANTSDSSDTQFQMLKSLEIPGDWYEGLLSLCTECSISFLSTGFDIDSLDLLDSMGCERFKIPSGEITNLPYLRHIGSFGKPLILSTGMSTLGDIESAIEVLEDAGMKRKEITVLHCNTEYPTPMADVNLRAMNSIREALGVEVGYSDHTLGIEVPIAAAALGAKVIEKHLTLDRSLPGPDHRASLEPNEFAAMVKAIRNIEDALGDGIKRPSASESKNRPAARKSLVAASPIKRGESFSPSNLAVKRPGTGISPMRWDEVMGLPAKRDFSTDEPIEL
jgi:N,N'-diacetyllegionaminate synthase